MDIYESKKESFRRRFEKMSDLSVRELCYGKLRICIFYISNFCSKNMIADQVIDPLSRMYQISLRISFHEIFYLLLCLRVFPVPSFPSRKL